MEDKNKREPVSDAWLKNSKSAFKKSLNEYSSFKKVFFAYVIVHSVGKHQEWKIRIR